MQMQGLPLGHSGLTADQKRKKLWGGGSAATAQPQAAAPVVRSRAARCQSFTHIKSQLMPMHCRNAASMQGPLPCTACRRGSPCHTLLSVCLQAAVPATFGANKWDTASFDNASDADKFARLMVSHCETMQLATGPDPLSSL